MHGQIASLIVERLVEQRAACTASDGGMAVLHKRKQDKSRNLLKQCCMHNKCFGKCFPLLGPRCSSQHQAKQVGLLCCQHGMISMHVTSNSQHHNAYPAEQHIAHPINLMTL